MNILIKIILGVYYFLLALVIVLQVIAFSNDVLYYNDVLAIVNVGFSIILVLSGINALRDRHFKWIGKPTLLLFIVGYLTWVVGNYTILRYLGLTDKDWVTIFTVPMIPCFIHNIWYYFHFDKITYDFKKYEITESIDYDDVFNLDLPYLKVMSRTDELLKVHLSQPYITSCIIINRINDIWFFVSTRTQ